MVPSLNKIVFYNLIIASLIVSVYFLSRKNVIGKNNYSHHMKVGKVVSLIREETGKEVSVAIQGKQKHHHILVTALEYAGQQGAGINALASLQCWAGHTGLPMSTLEPIISATKMLGSFSYEKSTLKLRDYFDINAASNVSGYAGIMSREDFLEQGPMDIVYIDTCPKIDKPMTFAKDESCMTAKKELSPLTTKGYCVKGVGSIHNKHLTTEKIQAILNRWHKKSVLVVFSRWQGPYFTHPVCEGIDRDGNTQIHPSPRLLKDAKNYDDLFNNITMSDDGVAAKKLAIMIRLEHTLLFTQKNSKYSVKKCLQQLLQSSAKLLGESDRIPILTADIGKYGSQSWSWSIKNKVELARAKKQTKDTIELLLNKKMSFERWEESFIKAADGVTNEAYIGALQRTVASRADCLVLMGGGHFQSLALKDYVRLHSRKKWCVKFICTDKGNHFERIMNLKDLV